jgi:amidase
MTDWADRSATEIVAGIRAKEVSSSELLAAFLERVERRRDLNAVVTLDVERATATAARADEAVAKGEPLGALHGLPMTVKDAFETEGLRTTSGAPELADHVPERDADAVARLRAAGAVIFGKTNLPLYAGDIQTYNEVFGTTNNPWDQSCGAGGSSGGAAAALAARLTPLELGSDIGGSIRNPAHYCGVTGLKPTYGIVPIRGHIPGPPGSLSEGDIGVAGPMARTVPDLELALDVLAGPDEARAVAWRLELPPPRADALEGYRVATWLDDPFAPVDRSVLDVLEGAVGTLADGGARVDEGASLGVDLEEIAEVYVQLLLGVLANGFPPEVLAVADEAAAALDPGDRSLQTFFLRGMAQRKREWNVVHERREQIRARWAELFTRVDVLLCPIAGTAAFPHDHNPDQLARTVDVNGEQRPGFETLVWAGLSGMAHLPSAVVPVGKTAEGKPVGIQVVAPYLEDRTALDVAGRLHALVGDIGAPPEPALA